MTIFEACNNPFHASIIHILRFLVWKIQFPVLEISLVGGLTLLAVLASYHFKIALISYSDKAVVIVGLMFATITCYVDGFVSYS